MNQSNILNKVDEITREEVPALYGSASLLDRFFSLSDMFIVLEDNYKNEVMSALGNPKGRIKDWVYYEEDDPSPDKIANRICLMSFEDFIKYSKKILN